MTTEHWCDQCAEEPARYLRDRWAVCESCARWIDARVVVRAQWQSATFTRAWRAWETR